MAALERLDGDRCARCAQSYGSPQALDADGVCGVCRREPPAYDRLFASGPYEGSLRRAIQLLKYDGLEPLATVLGERAAEALGRPDSYDAIVPAPLHRSRLRMRGFNQAALIAREAGRRLGLPVECGWLVRVKPTPPQAGLTRRERRENLRGAFRVPRREDVRGKRVLLADDVATTGATFEACARALKRAGASHAAALAVARARPEASG